MSIVKTTAHLNDTIRYFKYYNILTENPIGSILFNQIIYWFVKNNSEPFYKFRQRPQMLEDESIEDFSERVKPYRLGDSWCEELGISGKKFDSALKRIAECKNKIPQSKNKERETDEEYIERMNNRKKLIAEYDILLPNETNEDRETRIENNIGKYLKCCISYKVDKLTNITYYDIDNIEFLNKLLKEQIHDKIDSSEWSWNGKKFIKIETRNSQQFLKNICEFPETGKSGLEKKELSNGGFPEIAKRKLQKLQKENPLITETTSENIFSYEKDIFSYEKIPFDKKINYTHLKKSSQHEPSSSKNASHFLRSEVQALPSEACYEQIPLSTLNKTKSPMNEIKSSTNETKSPMNRTNASIIRIKAPTKTIEDDKIDKLINFWNDLENVTHHKNKETKVYKKCRNLIKSLLNGTFTRKHLIDGEYAEKYINSELLDDHKFTPHEIKEGFLFLSQFLTDGYSINSFKFKPATKSLDYLLYNNQRNTSYFLFVLSNPPVQSKFNRIDLDNLPYDNRHFNNFYRMLNWSDQEDEESLVNLACGIQNLIRFHDRNFDEFSHYRLRDLDYFLELYRSHLNLKFRYVKPTLVGTNSYAWRGFCHFIEEECHEEIGDLK